ncbi:hypothetical protein [Streptomyces platensis]|uniref:hypothetical protein n=1 Tax=Streptomyces platensis TaxID=58346 RepID=UPI0037B5BCAD
MSYPKTPRHYRPRLASVVQGTAALRARFPQAVLPSRIVPVPEIPRTATGKVLRPRLAEALAG